MACWPFTAYRTRKQLEVESKCVGITYTLLLTITATGIFAIIFHSFYFEKSYQKHVRGESSISIDLRGATEVGESEIWDDVDLKQPAQENDAFFIATKLSVINQSRSICGESADVIGANCTEDSNCTAGILLHLGHGITTGKCTKDTSTCQVKAWCPIQTLLSSEHGFTTLIGTENFTAKIKNYVDFPSINGFVSNIDGRLSEEKLQTCTYNKVSEPLCPVFRLEDIVSYASPNSSVEEAYKDIACQGGIIQIGINWDCNFDYNGWVKGCTPEFTFTRLDTSRHQPPGKGYTSHRVSSYSPNRKNRTLVEVYGIFFVINVDAIGRKFNWLYVFTSLGSGFGLLTLTEIVCEFLINYFCVCKCKTKTYSCRSCSSATDDEDKNSRNLCCSSCCCIIKIREDVYSKKYEELTILVDQMGHPSARGIDSNENPATLPDTTNSETQSLVQPSF